jgi:gluconolactonase
VDREGRLFVSSDDAIQVVSPQGKLLGKIMVPERISNCTFAGRNEDVLYITATTSLYRIKLAARGGQYTHLL